jgi:hypothetical protein
MKDLGLDAVYSSEIERTATGKACWCMRASKTLTYRMLDIAREHGVDGLENWFIGVVPTPAWPTDTTFHVLVIDDKRKHWGLHELMGEDMNAVDRAEARAQEHQTVQ